MITSTNIKVNSQENLFREITSEEASYISGGWPSWDEVKEGGRDILSGAADSKAGKEAEADNYNYLGGYVAYGLYEAFPG